MTDDEYARRDVLNKVVGVFAGAIGVLTAEEAIDYLSQGGGSGAQAGGGSPEPGSGPQGYSPGKLYEWGSIKGCLSDEQEDSVLEYEERSEDFSRHDVKYSIETDGNLIIREPDESGYKPVVETTDNNFMCDIDY